MDPALDEAVRRLPSDREIEVAAVLVAGLPVPEDLRVVATFREVITGRVRIDRVAAVRRDPVIFSLKAPRVVGKGDVRLGGRGAPSPEPRLFDRGVPGATGAGCLLAFLDWGCDFAHPNLRAPDGRTRLRAIWDQRGPGDGNRWGYGRVLSRARIDEALRTPDPYAALGYHPGRAGAHGTHVMDIAAGSGGLAGSARGVAPEAELLFVHLATGLRTGDLGDSVRILEALDFVREAAAGDPFVVNMSLGRTAGDHTGRSCVERGMDALLEEAPGRAIAQSAGNYSGKDLHAAGVLSPGGTAVLEWMVEPGDPTTNELELWYPGTDRFRVDVALPSGGAVLRLELGERAPIVAGGVPVGFAYHRECDPLNGDHHVDLFLDPAAPAGTWEVRLVGEDVVDGRWHAWIERDPGGPLAQSRFRPDVATDDATIGTIATGRRTLVVGAIDGQTDLPAPFSSRGPSRDGRGKPDAVAPGVAIVAARSTPPGAPPGSGGLLELSGTSMASPHVAGAVAALFGAAPRPLLIAETRLLVLGSARRLQGDRLRLGAGALDTAAALAALRCMFDERKGTMANARQVDVQPVGTWTSGAGELDRELEEALGPIDAYDVVGWPSAPLLAPVQAGDVVIRADPANPARPLVARIVSDGILPLATLGAAESEAEGDGLYAEALQRTRYGWSAAPAYRRVVARDHRVPPGQIVIRPSVTARGPAAPAPATPSGEPTPEPTSGPVEEPTGLEPEPEPEPDDQEDVPTPTATVAGTPVVLVTKRGASPARKAVTLRVSAPFEGNATLSWSRGLQLFDAATAGTELSPSTGVRLTAAQLGGAGGLVVHVGARAHGTALGDQHVTLTLPGPGGATATAALTAVELTLDVFKGRTAPAAAPAQLSVAEKLGTGRFLQVQDGAGRAGRARLLVHPPEPAAFADDLIVSAPAQLRLFAAETGGGALGATVTLAHARFAAGPVELWAEGAAHSAALSDVRLRLGVAGDLQGDSAQFTVVELTSLTATVDPTPPHTVRAGLPAALVAATTPARRTVTTLARDLPTNPPLVVLRNSQPTLALEVAATPADVPLRWEVVRDAADHAAIGPPSRRPVLSAGSNARTHRVGTDERGTFQVRAFIDTNGTGTFDAGEPVIALNLVLVEAREVAGGEATRALPGSPNVIGQPAFVQFISGTFASPSMAATLMDLLVDVVGGGADGTVGLGQIGAGLINDLTLLDVAGEYRSGATEHPVRLEVVSNGAAAALALPNPPFPPGSPASLAMAPAAPTPVPARLQLPTLDSGRPGAGTGGITATMSGSQGILLGPPPAAAGAPRLGLRVRILCPDSPGFPFLRNHPVVAAAVLHRIRFHTHFLASFSLWSLDAPQTYLVVRQREWSVDADVEVAPLVAGPNALPLTTVASTARPLRAPGRAQDLGVEVRLPSDIDATNRTLIWDATH